jgi:hypothetical protein
MACHFYLVYSLFVNISTQQLRLVSWCSDAEAAPVRVPEAGCPHFAGHVELIFLLVWRVDVVRHDNSSDFSKTLSVQSTAVAASMVKVAHAITVQ